MRIIMIIVKIITKLFIYPLEYIVTASECFFQKEIN